MEVSHRRASHADRIEMGYIAGRAKVERDVRKSLEKEESI
jgi:hypothetical protein